ncbi:MAG: KH domain-containing protein [Acidobacteriota bacterium]|nr:KH domain-containing protein [Acidobacteriota bacterium]
MALQELRTVIRLLVDEPREVEIGEDSYAGTTSFEVRVAEEDLGKVIGRQGRTARALRTLLGGRGTKDGDVYELKILD